MTRKQQRANARMSHARHKKERAFHNFLTNLARRKMADSDEIHNLMFSFCCTSQSLGMPLDEFMAAGQKLVGGAAFFYGHGKLEELLPDWECSNRMYPHMLTAEYLNEFYDSNGNLHRDQPRGEAYRNSTRDQPRGEAYRNSTSSGSWA